MLFVKLPLFIICRLNILMPLLMIKKPVLSNYDSYIKTIRNINTDIYSTFGMIEITIINLKNIISGMASSKVMKSYSSSHKQLQIF